MKQDIRYLVRRWIVLLAGLTGFAGEGWSEGLSGVVADAQGNRLEGVMVSLVDRSERRFTTRFSDENGVFRFERLAADEAAVRVRLPGFADRLLPLDATSPTLDVVLQPASQEQLLQQLPAHVWAERVRKTNDRVRREFRIQCMMCHQQGYPHARWPKNREQWYSVYERMAHKSALLTRETRETMADALLKAYDTGGGLGMPRIPAAPSGKATEVEISEWRLDSPTASMHDVAVGPDGKIYGVDTVGSNIWRLDPQTSQIETLDHLYPGNRGDSPLLLHTVFQAPDGKMWFTYALGNLIASLDVRTGTMKVHEISYFDGIYPHTMRFDQDGQIWFTVALTNQLGTIDPDTDEVVLYDMPTRNVWQSLATWPPVTGLLFWAQQKFDIVKSYYDELLPVAYGIDVTPDGKIWFSQFNNRRIGSFDKKTGTFEMVDTPFGGPRRFRSDSRGVLWIPAFTDGLVYRYNPAAKQFTPMTCLPVPAIPRMHWRSIPGTTPSGPAAPTRTP